MHTLYSILTPTEQWELHDFYRLSEDLTKQQLIVHRHEITKRRPSLPHRAGKHRKKLFTVYLLAAKHSAGNQAHFNDIIRFYRRGISHKFGNRRIRVAAVVNPQIDLERLARALIELEYQKSRGNDYSSNDV
jgi:hypothetical protein